MTEINVNLQDSSTDINVEIQATGPQGSRGPKGEEGDPGPVGPKGEKGDPAVITLESVQEGLGYTPANKEEVEKEISSLSEDLDEKETVLTDMQKKMSDSSSKDGFFTM